MVPWTAGKNCGYQFLFAISTFLFHDLTFEMFIWNLIGPNFHIFLSQKIKTQKIKTFAKIFCIYKKRISKIFAIPLYLFMEQDVECFFFHFSTINFRNANTTYSKEQNLIVLSRVYWKSFCGTPDTENTSAGVQKCFWNEQIPRNGCQDIIPKVIIPNAKITNAILPNVK